MAKFKVGDRVRIVKSLFGITTGKEASVVIKFSDGDYGVVIDGYPNKTPYGCWKAPSDWLAPLINPDEQAWIAFRDLHLKPDPALILAKEAA